MRATAWVAGSVLAVALAWAAFEAGVLPSREAATPPPAAAVPPSPPADPGLALNLKYDMDEGNMVYRFRQDRIAGAPWATQQAERARRSLASSPGYTTLVLPVLPSGEMEWGARFYAAGEVRQWYIQQGERVPPIEWVRDALGMHMREYSLQDVFALANTLKVRRIVWGYAGANSRFGQPGPNSATLTTHSIRFHLVRQEAPADGQWAIGKPMAEEYVHCEKSQDNGEIRVLKAFADCRATLQAGLKLTAVATPVVDAGSGSTDVLLQRLPTPEEYAQPLARALYLQWLAMLTPDYVVFRRQEYFARSLLALSALADTAPHVRLLRARAYLHMGMRPHAVSLLTAPLTVEENAFLALANGNLAGLDEAIARIPDPLLRVMADIERIDLQYRYTENVSEDEIREIVAQAPVWAFELRRRLADGDVWQADSTLGVKESMDSWLPVQGFSVEDVNQSAKNEADPSNAVLLVETAFQKHADALWLLWDKEAKGHDTPEADLLGLLEGLGQAGLVRQIRYSGFTQGRPEKALQWITLYERVFAGQPEFMQMKLRLVEKTSKTGTGRQVEASQVDKETLEETFQYFYEPYCCSRRYDAIASHYKHYESEWSHDDIALLENDIRLAETEGEDPGYLDQQLQSRFEGHPRKPVLAARKASAAQDAAGAEQFYQQAIAQNPYAWDLVYERGQALAEAGQLEQAAKVLQQYKPFSEGPKALGRVELSNNAYDAGNILYWGGDYQASRPFYAIAAGLETGSVSYFKATAKIAMLDGQWQQAAEQFLQCGRRYQASHCLGAYVSLQLLAGQGADVATAADDIVRKVREKETLDARLRLQQHARQADSAMCEWISQMEAIEPALKQSGMGDYYRYSMARMDRPGVNTPGAVLPCLAAATDKPITSTGEYLATQFQFEQAVLTNNRAAARKAVGRLYAYCNQMPVRMAIFQQTFWACDFAHYERLSQFLAGELQPVTQSPTLPADAGMEAYLDAAVIQAGRGQHTEAQAQLRAASLRLSKALSNKNPVAPQYVLLEFAEALYRATGDKGYASLMVEWCEVWQHLLPWEPWLYSVEAAYTDSPARRVRALAIADFLDPAAAHLASVPESEREAARNWFRQHPPFGSRAGR